MAERFDQQDGTPIAANWVAPRNVRFAMIPLLLAANLTAGGLKVSLAALWRANGETGKCQWPYRILGREAGLSRDGYTRALKDVEASQLCTITRPRTTGQAPAEFCWRWDLARAFMEACEVPGANPNPVDFLPVAPPAKKRSVIKKSDTPTKTGQSEKRPTTLRIYDGGVSDFPTRECPTFPGTNLRKNLGTNPGNREHRSPAGDAPTLPVTDDTRREVIREIKDRFPGEQEKLRKRVDVPDLRWKRLHQNRNKPGYLTPDERMLFDKDPVVAPILTELQSQAETAELQAAEE